MKPDVCVVTGNPWKWKVLHDNVGDMLNLVQAPVETPEIQALDVVEVATFSALWAAKELGKPVLKTDVGYFITALGGFPGPFVKWANQTLVPDNVLAMLDGVASREVIVREALVYAEPGGYTDHVLLVREGRIRDAGPQTGRDKASLFDKLVIEYGKLSAETPVEEFLGKITDAYRADYRELAGRIAARAGTLRSEG